MKKGISLLLSSFGLFVFSGFFSFAFAFSTMSLSGQQGTSVPTYFANPSTPSSTPVSIDSRIVPPMGTTQRPSTIQHPGVSLPTPYLSNERYDVDLSACPLYPGCPDINGKLPAGVTLNCPKACTVTRTVSFFNPGDSSSPIIGVFSPVCPKDYSAVASYKMDKEVVRTIQKEAAPFPIDSLATYNAYVGAGYDCSEQVYNAAQYASNCYFYDPKFASATPQMINGYVGVYTNYATSATHYSIGSNCGIPVIDPNQAYYVSYSVRWRYIRCYRLPGQLYYSNNMVPTAVVCTHVEPTWQTGN